MAKAGNRTERQTLTAPIDGVVQQLAVHTVGGRNGAQQLMVLVPQDQPLEIEAWIDNKDIGFVHAGQLAEVKIAAFPFTRYGTVKARLVMVSHDAVPLDKSNLVYAARVSLNTPSCQSMAHWCRSRLAWPRPWKSRQAPVA